MTVHNEAKKEDIAKVVIMPGDPLRAKYIAINYLKDAKQVNAVRNVLAYTGFFEGMPSMGIYCYELFKFYDVDTIIRIGSCGAYVEDAHLLETLLVDGSFTNGNFALNYDGQNEHYVKADEELNNINEETSRSEKIKIKK